MEDITDILRDRDNEKFERYLESEKYKRGIPKYVLRALEKKRRYYHTEDIKDIIDHYEILSSTKYVPLAVLWWEFEHPAPRRRLDQWSPSLQKDLKLYKSLASLKHGLKYNLNVTSMGNVTLNNFEFIHGENFEAVEFDISDNLGEEIRGILIYESGFKPLKRGGYNKHLENIFGEGGAYERKFDLVYSAMDEKYKIKQNGKSLPRGKKLVVHKIGIDDFEDPKHSRKRRVPTKDLVTA